MTPSRRTKHPRNPKDAEIKARVSESMKREIEELARDRGEASSLIIREALRAYLDATRMPADTD